MSAGPPEIGGDQQGKARADWAVPRRTGRRLGQTAREYLLSRMPKRSVCAEIGVYEGEFSRRILDAVKPRRLHLIDPWKHEEGDRYREAGYGCLGPGGQAIMDERYRRVQQRFAEEIRAGRVQIHRSPSSAASEHFGDSYFDWGYIDGNHRYEFLSGETCSCTTPRSRPAAT